MLSVRLGFLTCICLLAWTPFASAQDTSGPFSRIDPTIRVDLNASEVQLSQVLQKFAADYRLSIIGAQNVTGAITINLHQAPVQEAFEQILAAGGYTYEVKGSFVIVTPATATGPSGTGPTPFDPEIIFLNHLRAADVVPMLEPLLGAGEEVVPGPPSSTGIEDISDLGGNAQATREMLAVMTSEETRERIYELLTKIDIPPLQVQVQATILSVSLSDEFILGVDFAALGGVDFQALDSSTNIVDGINDPPVPNSELGGWLFGARQRGFAQGGSNGLHVGILRNQIGLFVEALEEVGAVSVVSNPMVTALNRHPAEILIGRKIAYLTIQQTDSSSIQTVQFLEVGTSLIFRPYVSDDGYIRMEIHPESSDGSVNAATGLPEETTTEVSTNVLVRDGHTIVIGGLMEHQVVDNTSQVPFLGSLPLFGSFFRREEQSEARLEVIIMLTPRIVSDNDLALQAENERKRLTTTISKLAASHHGYLRPSYARKMHAEAIQLMGANRYGEALAKAEFGLVAMPADPELAVLARHLREELHAQTLENVELEAVIELLDQISLQQD